jgi:hypothetical protein
MDDEKDAADPGLPRNLEGHAIQSGALGPQLAGLGMGAWRKGTLSLS